MKTAELTEIAELEAQITKRVYEDNKCTVQFIYEQTNNINVNVKALTYNPTSKEFFLLASTNGLTQESALKMMLTYMENHKEKMDSYTVTWWKKGEKEQTSYFYCKDLSELAEKFYYNKDKSLYTVSNVKLNPMS